MVPSLDLVDEVNSVLKQTRGAPLTVDCRRYPDVTLIVCSELKQAQDWETLTVYVNDPKEEMEICELFRGVEKLVYTITEDEEEVVRSVCRCETERSHAVHYHSDQRAFIATGTHHGVAALSGAADDERLTLIGLNRATTTVAVFTHLRKHRYGSRVRIIGCHLTTVMTCFLLSICASLDLSRTCRLPRSIWEVLPSCTLHSLSLNETYTDDYRHLMVCALQCPSLKRLAFIYQSVCEDFSFLGETFLRAYAKLNCLVIDCESATSFGTYIEWSTIYKQVMAKPIKPGFLVYPLERREITVGMTGAHDLLHRLKHLGRELHLATSHEYGRRNPYEGFHGFRDLLLDEGLHSSSACSSSSPSVQ
jgi:hypothetical protein